MRIRRSAEPDERSVLRFVFRAKGTFYSEGKSEKNSLMVNVLVLFGTVLSGIVCYPLRHFYSGTCHF